MGKASSSKKVARAARTGGGRTRRGSTSWLWPSLLAVIVVLGTAGVVYSREQRQPDTSRPLASGSGKAGDHWHAAIGFYICGEFQPNISEAADPLGIHTHDDGIVHIHPFLSRSAGKNAKLGVFFDTVKAKVTSTQIKLPGQDARKNGQKCGDKDANVQVKIWATRGPDEKGTLFKGDPGDIRLEDNQLITVAFVPDGTDIPKPPSEPQLDKLSDVGTTPVPDELASTTTTPAGVTTETSVPPDSSTIPPETTTPPPAP
ncbi:MAG: hypothetical protein QOG43_414 [Actinomycetota bacterium]|jgi:hypothetical protein|nr:hypothetical protein [Actinomycetota bacterium]